MYTVIAALFFSATMGSQEQPLTEKIFSHFSLNTIIALGLIKWVIGHKRVSKFHELIVSVVMFYIFSKKWNSGTDMTTTSPRDYSLYNLYKLLPAPPEIVSTFARSAPSEDSRYQEETTEFSTTLVEQVLALSSRLDVVLLFLFKIGLIIVLMDHVNTCYRDGIGVHWHPVHCFTKRTGLMVAPLFYI